MSFKKRKNRPAKPNHTGRNAGARRFVMLDHRILFSEAYASLDAVGRALLVEVVSIYNGSNNGSIWLSVRDATARLGMSDHRATQRGFDQLQAAGLIALTKDAHFSQKTSDSSRARCWRLTWERWVDATTGKERLPTHEWQDYRPAGQTKESKRAATRLNALSRFKKGVIGGHFPVVDFSTPGIIHADNDAVAVEDSTTLNPANGRNPPFLRVVDSTTYIHSTRGRGEVTLPMVEGNTALSPLPWCF